MEGAKNGSLLLSKLFLAYTRRKHDTLLDFAASLRQRKILKQKVTFAAPFMA